LNSHYAAVKPTYLYISTQERVKLTEPVFICSHRAPESKFLSLRNRFPSQEGATEPIELDVVVEVPRGSFLKRGSTGRVDFISPLPCPFNYGSVPQYLGLEGDLLDAVVLGPRLPFGSHVRVKAWGAVTLTDRGMSDDKLICSSRPLDPAERRRVLRFFHFYAKCKGLLNLWRRRPGRNACDGWCEAEQAIARARPRTRTWQGPPVEF